MADYKNTVSRTLHHEGGLSKDPKDASAAKNPVPDGKGYHTNKGVTWATFTSLASKLGYIATPALFYQMPMDIWLKIFKVGYWDAIDGTNIKSQAVANMLVQRAWGSGASRANTMIQQLLNELGYKVAIDGKKGNATTSAINRATATKAKEKEFVKKFFDKNMAFLKSLSVWPVYKNGWTKRWDELYKSSLDLVEGNPVKTAFFFNDSDTDSDIS